MMASRLGIDQAGEKSLLFFRMAQANSLRLDVHDRGVRGASLKKKGVSYLQVEPGDHIPEGSKCIATWCWNSCTESNELIFWWTKQMGPIESFCGSS